MLRSVSPQTVTTLPATALDEMRARVPPSVRLYNPNLIIP